MNTIPTKSGFKHIGPVRRSQQIVDQISQAINCGSLAPGDKLPNQRELIKQFDTSLKTLREALGTLEAQGVIEIKVGSKGGAFIKQIKPMDVNTGLEQLLRGWDVPLENITEFRRGIEGLAASEAVKNIRPEDIIDLNQQIEIGREKKIRGEFDLRSFFEWDFSLHLSLAKSGANPLYHATINLILRKILDFIDTVPAEHLTEPQFYIAEFLEDWADILQALEQGQADRLKSIVQSHIRKSSQMILDIRDAQDKASDETPQASLGENLKALTSESNQEAIFMFAGVDPTDQDRSEPEPVSVNKWRIPGLGWWTGEWGALGQESKFAINAAVEEINRSGGIRGVPMELTWFDTGYDKKKSISVMKSALESNPLILIGPMPDIALSVACPIAYRNRVFILSGMGDNIPFIDFYPWGTSLLNSIEGMTKMAAEFWLGLHGKEVESIAIFTNPVSISIQRQADVFRKTFEQRQITVLPNIEIPTQNTNFGPFVHKALESGAGAFINLNLPRQSAGISIELFKKGVKQGWRIINYPAADHALLYETANGYLEGTYIYNLYNKDYPSKNWKKLMKKYRNWKNDPAAHPSMMVPSSYDIPFIIKDAFEKANITGARDRIAEERVKIRDHILDLNGFEGIQGAISIVKGTGGAITPFFFYKIKNNRPELIATLEPEMILPA